MLYNFAAFARPKALNPRTSEVRRDLVASFFLGDAPPMLICSGRTSLKAQPHKQKKRVGWEDFFVMIHSSQGNAFSRNHIFPPLGYQRYEGKETTACLCAQDESHGGDSHAISIFSYLRSRSHFVHDQVGQRGLVHKR